MSDKDDFRARTDVSRETFEMLEVYADLLVAWNARINLVSPKSLDTLWTRHFLDSAQLFQHGEHARHWVDLGSGGGFPGAVIAILRGPDQQTTLIEAISASRHSCVRLPAKLLDSISSPSGSKRRRPRMRTWFRRGPWRRFLSFCLTSIDTWRMVARRSCRKVEKRRTRSRRRLNTGALTAKHTQAKRTLMPLS